MKNIVYTVPLYTSVKIIKNEVGCWDDTVPKTVETCEGHATWSQSYLTVLSIHPTSFLMNLTLVSLMAKTQ